MEKKNNWKAWLYLAPVVILTGIFIFYPLINTIGIAFLKNYSYLTGTSDGFTFDNFGYVLGITPRTYMGVDLYYTDVIRYAVPNTLIIVFVTVPLSIIISLLIAVGLNSIKWLKKIFQTIFFIPYVTNAIAVGMVFAVIFDGFGLWNYLFGLVVPSYWIDMGADPAKAMFALCVYIIWHSLPFKILILLSGLQNIDKQYYDAAKVDSATKFKTFTSVTVPLLSPQILYIMITSFIGAFKEYSSVMGLLGKSGTALGNNNMYTIVFYIYDSIDRGNVHYGAAAAVMLFIVILIFTGLQFWISKKRVHY
ncbi:MAG: sugar ABC transporter permease [Bacilli bacterium]|nr:sugar ABC transporter permease [Bacteroidia bacterium]